MSQVFINDDFDSFYAFQELENLNAAGIDRQLDFYTRYGGHPAILFCLNGSRAYFDSEAFEPIWHDLELSSDGEKVLRNGQVLTADDAGQFELNAYRGILTLRRRLPDFVNYRLTGCRKRGAEAWISMRMNDMHGIATGSRRTPGSVRLCSFWREHPEYRRAAYRIELGSHGWTDECLDYGEPAVREHHLALVREYLSKFDIDGLELDWMRHLPVFRPGFDDPGIEILNGFVKEVRLLARAAEKSRGHRIRIAVRVPSAPDDALAAGLDPVHWSRQGWCDVVIPAPLYQTCDSELPVKIWRDLLPANVRLIPGLDFHSCPSVPGIPMLDADAAIDRGYASAYYRGGADGIYLFNHFPYGETRFADVDAQQRSYALLADAAAVDRLDRRCLVTFRDNAYIEGLHFGYFMDYAVGPKAFARTRINAGSAVAGRRVSLVAAFGEKDPAIRVWLNGAELPPAVSAPALPRLPAAKDFYVREYEIPSGLAHDGVNLVEYYNTGNEPVLLRWLELDVAAEKTVK